MREKPTKSREISERLRQEILDGKFDDARKLPSEHQLMRRFSAARETVRAALKELLDKRLVERRHGYGTFLADIAKTKAAQKFAMIVPDAYYSFYERICRGITDAAKERGWTILSAALGSGSMRERAVRAVEFSEVCIREKVSGLGIQAWHEHQPRGRRTRTHQPVLVLRQEQRRHYRPLQVRVIHSSYN